MGEWKQNIEYGRAQIMDGKKCIASVPSPTAPDSITMAHNAEMAALTAERDEWRDRCIETQKSVDWARAERDEYKRRLDAVLELLAPDEDAVEGKWWAYCYPDKIHARAVEIAESKA